MKNNIITTACKEMSKVAVLNEMTAIRANVIANRTQNTLCGMTKAMMIELLKTKLREGVAHFYFVKKDGTLREAWGTTKKELVSSHVNGRGMSRENYLCFLVRRKWSLEKFPLGNASSGAVMHLILRGK